MCDSKRDIGLKAPRHFRLSRRADIDKVFADGANARDSLAIMIGRPNGLGHSRFGVGVSRRHGNAVARNRVKRLCREAMRLSRPELPVGWDLMLLPKAGARLSLSALRQTVVSLGRRLADRAQAGGGPRGGRR